MAIDICARLAEGAALTAICRSARMPSVKTVYAWRASDPNFARLLDAARNDQADTYFYLAIEAAKRPAADMVEVQQRRTYIDTLKWAAGRLKPKAYGDKVALGGAEDLPPVSHSLLTDRLEIARRIAFALRRGEQALNEMRANGGAPSALPYNPFPPVNGSSSQ